KLERLELLGQALGVVEAVHADADRSTSGCVALLQAPHLLLRVGGGGGLLESLHVYRDRESPHAAGVPVESHLAFLEVDLHARQELGAADEVFGERGEVEAEQIVGQQAAEEVLTRLRQAEDLNWWPGDVPEVGERQSGPTTADHARGQGE